MSKSGMARGVYTDAEFKKHKDDNSRKRSAMKKHVEMDHRYRTKNKWAGLDMWRDVIFSHYDAQPSGGY